MSTSEHAALIARRFPTMAVRTCEPIGDGWTCDSYLVDDSWIVQLPRSAYAAARLRAQLAFLPELAREVSAAIPDPIGADGEPPMFAYRAIEGVSSDDATDGIWPERLGRFLYDLHAVPPEFVGLRATTAAAVRDADRTTWTTIRGDLADVVDPLDLGALDRLVAVLLDDDHRSFAPVLTHRDLGPEHVLVDDEGDLAGVIDWEEAGLGDPAADLAWWLHERPAAGERALAAYGGAPDRGFRERARLLWALMPWHEVHHGVTSGRPALVRSGLEGARAREEAVPR